MKIKILRLDYTDLPELCEFFYRYFYTFYWQYPFKQPLPILLDPHRNLKG